jgi:Domain of unknown function (DUF4190)
MSEMGNENNQAPVEQPQASMQGIPCIAPNAPGSVGALVCGIIGLFFCGPILGIIAIVLGNKAKKAIATQPGVYGGAGLAQAGFILGIISVAVWVLFIAIYIIAMIIAAAAAAATAQ